MQSTQLVQAIEQLRGRFLNQAPPSDMEVVRQSVLRDLARMHQIEMPPILTTAQREVFAANMGVVSEFLSTTDGADAVELLVNAFTHFVDNRTTPPDETPDVQVDEEDEEEEEEGCEE